MDAIAAIPPIYFKLPPHAIAQYWNDISAAAPNTDFVIYNIPQLAGVSLTPALLREMLKNPRVIGVKNSSMPIQDDCLKIILALCSCKGNMYAVIKECIRRLGGPDCGGVRAPLYNLVPEDMTQVDKCVEMIRAAYEKHL